MKTTSTTIKKPPSFTTKEGRSMKTKISSKKNPNLKKNKIKITKTVATGKYKSMPFKKKKNQ